ncbi:MAG TPA: SusC/RagA family TonB-linked outer membrane protein [Gemmatimonadaceae bacterium]|nr:SusC/RagA family TonB-linked outer membrane protein [Gemmatimonadaceae bacterium]
MAAVRRLTLALVAGLLWSIPISAQNPVPPTGTITGRVVDAETQAAVPDVSVFVEGTRRGAVTASDGTFTIGGVPSGSQTVRARHIGFGAPVQVVTVPNGGSVSVIFSMSRQAAVLEEVVTTGYGTQRRLAITGSVATIDADQAKVAVPTNVTNLIEGRATGVQVTQNSGEPGAGAHILIRGGTSISASNEPLYVIDGVAVSGNQTEPGGFGIGGDPPLPRNPLNLINPADIANITILKDAAATAIYGARAANGVVLIETKKGSAGGPSMEYEFSAGSSWNPRRLDVLSGQQYRDFIQANVPGAFAGEGTANTNWEDALMRHAATINHNLSFAGGSANTQYRASLNFFDQDGVVIANGMKRYQARVNGTHQAIDGKLRMGLNLTGAHVINDYLPFNENTGFEGGVFINMVNFNPTHPITVTDPATGITTYYEIAPGAQSVRNPVAMANQVLDKGTSDRTLGNMSADYDLFPSLTARVNIGVDRTEGARNFYLPRASAVGAGFNGLAQRASRDETTKQLQTLLTFHPSLSNSKEVDIVGGYEFNGNTINEFGVQTRDYLTDAFTFNSLGSGNVVEPPYAVRTDSRLVSFFGRANLGLAEKYFMTFVLRKDGASEFGANHKWATFPAVSASWRLSQEGFMRTGPFSELRLRAGWGKQGNPAVPPYSSLILLGASGGSRYAFGDQPVTGVQPIRNANPDLKWEETAQTNVALDYGFLNNRLNGSLEYYVKNTHDLLLTVQVPQPAVVGDRLENIGKIRNKGIELSLDGLVMQRSQFTWNAGFAFSHDNNEVVDLGARTFIPDALASGQGQSNQFTQRIVPGEPLGTFYGPVFAGWNSAGQQLFNHYTVTRDANGRETSRELAGTVTSAGITGDDFLVLGSANPKYTLGIHTNGNWKSFDFSMLINRVAGQKVFNNTALVYSTKGNALQDKNFLASALNDPTAITEPAIYSSRWIEDGSFTRLANITIGYTFDMPAFTGIARGSRVYISGDNLALWTPYSGYDPEVHSQLPGIAPRGIDYLHYPRPRTFTGGLRVSF